MTRVEVEDRELAAPASRAVEALVGSGGQDVECQCGCECSLPARWVWTYLCPIEDCECGQAGVDSFTLCTPCMHNVRASTEAGEQFRVRQL